MIFHQEPTIACELSQQDLIDLWMLCQEGVLPMHRQEVVRLDDLQNLLQLIPAPPWTPSVFIMREVSVMRDDMDVAGQS